MAYGRRYLILRQPLRTGRQLQRGAALGAQPPATDRRVGVALDLDDLVVLDVHPLTATHGAVGADALHEAVGGAGARCEVTSLLALRGGAPTERVGAGDLTNDRPGQEHVAHAHVLLLPLPDARLTSAPRSVCRSARIRASPARHPETLSECRRCPLQCGGPAKRHVTAPANWVAGSLGRPRSEVPAPMPLLALACILPPGLLRRVATANPDALASALATWHIDTRLRTARAASAARAPGRAAGRSRSPGSAARRSARSTTSSTRSRRPPARSYAPRAPRPTGDKATDEAYDGFGATYNFYWQIFDRDSIDGQGLPILGLVHYGTDYDNAFWDGAGHMFFGDGDGKVLTRTTAGLDVIGHELTHGVTQNEANLDYSGQSGALNESMSDALGITIKQYALQQSAAQADWLIGADIVGPELQARPAVDEGPGHGQPARRPARRHGRLRRRRRRAHQFRHPQPRLLPGGHQRSAATPGRHPPRSGTTRCAIRTCRRPPPSASSRRSPSSRPSRPTARTAPKPRAVSGAWDTVKVPIPGAKKGSRRRASQRPARPSAAQGHQEHTGKSKPKKRSA